MKTRLASCALAIALVPLAALAQPQKIPRVGLLATGSRNALTDVLMRTFRELGYIEGQSIVIERRFAEGNLEQLPGFATELVKLKTDAILAVGTPASLALKQATSTIPIVFAGNSDPVGVGIVATLAHPGGNVTGTSLVASELSGKRLELLHDVSPGMAHIAILWDSSNPGMTLRVHETEVAAEQLHLVLRSVGPKNLDELEAAFAALAKQRPDALLVTTEPFTRRHLVRILEFSTLHRIPTIFEERTYVEAGGLMSYGPNLAEVFRRAVVYVDRILKGAKPADLPVEQPTTFELVINLKTARALGLTIPPSVLARADEVIQ
jgi:putative ABC transport system substrate-binding protein